MNATPDKIVIPFTVRDCMLKSLHVSLDYGPVTIIDATVINPDGTYPTHTIWPQQDVEFTGAEL